MNLRTVTINHTEGEVLHGPKDATVGTYTTKDGKAAAHIKSGKIYFDLTISDFAEILLGSKVRGIEITLADGRRLAA